MRKEMLQEVDKFPNNPVLIIGEESSQELGKSI
jgi:hypothetical protein